MERKATKLTALDFLVGYFVAIAGAVGLISLLRACGGFWLTSAGKLFSSIWVQDGLIALAVLLCLYLRGQGTSAIGLTRAKNAVSLARAALYGALIYILMDIALVVMNLVFSDGVKAQSVESYMKVGDSLGYIVFVVLSFAVVAPVAEELLFRGLLYNGLRNTMSSQGAMVLAALIFGLSHLDVQRALALSLGGYLLNLVSVKEESLWASIVAHGMWNLLMVLKFYAIL